MDIEAGSVVIVVAHPSGDNFMYNESEGFDNTWVKDMNKLVGTKQIVKSSNSLGVMLSDDVWKYRYPPLSLKLIEE